MLRLLHAALGLTLVFALQAGAAPLGTATTEAISADPVASAHAIAALRAEGPAGLGRLLDAYRDEVDLARRGRDAGPEWDRIRAALDGVGAQRDCYTSGLFWHTELERAKAEASRTGRPILSLRLLGRLDEELSCANSRYFRAALYANERVASLLSDRYVLHWSSERPAPRITIDYGDGRAIVRTVTGNSLHYVLDADGLVVDALPGLYSPQAFAGELDAIADEYRKLATLDADVRAERVRTASAAKRAATAREWADLVRRLRGRKIAAAPSAEPTERLPTPGAGRAAAVAYTKLAAELPVLVALDLATPPELRSFDDAIWGAIVHMRGDVVVLDERSRTLMRRHLASLAAGQPEGSEAMVFGRFAWNMALDTLRNEYAIRPAIHAKLAASAASRDLATLNGYVYDNLFLTPRSDPWLGLASPYDYTAIEGAGIVGGTLER